MSIIRLEAGKAWLAFGVAGWFPKRGQSAELRSAHAVPRPTIGSPGLTLSFNERMQCLL